LQNSNAILKKGSKWLFDQSRDSQNLTRSFLIFGVKPPKWWQEKYGKVSQQEPEAAKPKQSKTNH